MAVPSRTAQIASLVAYLEDSVDNERSATDVAATLIDKIYDMWTVDVRTAPQPVKLGFAFKTPMVSKIYHVAWIGSEEPGGEFAWCVDSTTDYGLLVPVNAPFWRVAIESVDNRKDKSKPRPGAGGYNNDGWEVGDKLSLLQRRQSFEILATGDRTVLMRNQLTDSLQADSNSNLKKYYNKERE